MELNSGLPLLPRGHGSLWDPALLGTQVLTDGITGLSYLAISATLAYLVHRERADMPFGKTVIAFGLFFLACGVTQFVEIWTLWHPHYWITGSVKAVTAAAALTTALALPPLAPKMLRIVRASREADERALERDRFFALSTDLLGVIGPDGVFRSVNPSFERILGHPPAVLLRRPFVDFVHPDDAARTMAEFATYATGGQSDSFENRWGHADGTYRWLSWSSAKPDGGGVVYVVARDVTPAHLAAAQREDNARRLQVALSAAQMGVWEWDIASGLTSWAPAVPLANLPDADTRNTRDPEVVPFDQFVGMVMEDDRAALLDALETARASGTAYEHEFRLLNSAGEYVWMLGKGVPVYDAKGRVRGFVGAGLDISARKHDEQLLQEREAALRVLAEQLHHLVTAGPAMIYSARLAGQLVVTFVSDNVRGQLAHEPSDFTSQPEFWTSHIHPDDRAEVLANLAHHVRARGTWEHEFRFQHGSGDYRWLHDSLRIVDMPDGGTEIIGWWLDITERKEAEETAREREQRSREAQKMEAVGRLAGGIAHDFNNMLAVILSYATMLLEDLPTESALAHDVNEIARAAQRAAELTRQLLAFSRQQVLQPQIVDLNVVITEVESMVRRVIGENLRIETRLSPVPVRMMGEANQLQQILVNLALNARDAMPDGGVLRIATDEVLIDELGAAGLTDAAPGRYARLRVTDTGTGMTEEIRLRAFEPFFTTKDVGKGTGLGLSSVYGYVQQSGGQIALRSRPGRGTTIELFFPSTDAHAQLSPDSSDDESADQVSGGATVLLVEDERQLRDVTARALSRRGYQVLVAENGVAALQVLEGLAVPPDLVITDVVMPGMGGIELIRNLNGRYPTIRVLMISGYAEELINRPMAETAHASFLEKPFTQQALLDTVRLLLDRPRSSGPHSRTEG